MSDFRDAIDRKIDAVIQVILTLTIGIVIGVIWGVSWYDGKYRPGIEKYLQECSQHYHQGSGHASDDR